MSTWAAVKSIQRRENLVPYKNADRQITVYVTKNKYRVDAANTLANYVGAKYELTTDGETWANIFSLGIAVAFDKSFVLTFDSHEAREEGYKKLIAKLKAEGVDIETDSIDDVLPETTTGNEISSTDEKSSTLTTALIVAAVAVAVYLIIKNRNKLFKK